MIDITPLLATLVRLSFIIPLAILAAGIGIIVGKATGKYRRLAIESFIVAAAAELLALSVPFMMLTFGVGSVPVQYVAVVIVYILALLWVGRIAFIAASQQK